MVVLERSDDVVNLSYTCKINHAPLSGGCKQAIMISYNLLTGISWFEIMVCALDVMTFQCDFVYDTYDIRSTGSVHTRTASLRLKGTYK